MPIRRHGEGVNRFLLRLVLTSLLGLALLLGAAGPARGWWPADPAPLPDGIPSASPGAPQPPRPRDAASSRASGTGAPASQIPSERGYVWPTGGETEVLRGFDPPTDQWDPGHRGVDLAHPSGAEVLSAGDGVVAFAGWVVDRHVISIDHAEGIRTTYEPVGPAVQAGEAVGVGDLIGHLAPGHCDGLLEQPTCLHWGARMGPDNYIDPMSLLGERPVIRLLPIGGR